MTKNTNKKETGVTPGYQAVLCREETKKRLREMRLDLAHKDFLLERRLVTAAIEFALDEVETSEEALKRLLDHVKKTVERDLHDQWR